MDHTGHNKIISIQDALIRLKKEFPDAGPWQLMGALFAALEERNIDTIIYQITCADAFGSGSASDYYIQNQSDSCEFDTAEMIENLSSLVQEWGGSGVVQTSQRKISRSGLPREILDPEPSVLKFTRSLVDYELMRHELHAKTLEVSVEANHIRL